jgi:(R,R)-butanediol dehydrogenase / meso-butanediol dehydrogenase / diacetyl reductase
VSDRQVLPVEMAAAVYHGPGQLAVERRDVPRPGPGELLVEVAHCGVCGSDLHMVIEGLGAPGYVGGHEFAGTVVAVGADTSGWAVGDRVIGGPWTGCGQCPACREGRPSLCERRDEPSASESTGGFAGYTILATGATSRVPDGLSLRAAALTEPLAVALHGITRSGLPNPPTEQRVLVMGAGPIGALTVAALVARGTGEVAVCEPAPARQDLARRLGATRVVGPDELDVPTRFEPGRVVADAVDVVLECSGKAAGMTGGLAQLRRGGTLVLVGAGMDSPRFDPNRILLNEPVITGSFLYDRDGFTRALELLASGRLPLDVLIEDGDVPLSGLLGAMQHLAEGKIAGKVLIAPGGNDA